MDAKSDFIKYFPNFEQREQAFRERIFNLVPRTYAGPSRFWMDFSGTRFENPLWQNQAPLAYITSNPTDCLAFGTPAQVIRAAILTTISQGHQGSSNLDSICNEFGLTDVSNQPIQTLSGGETVQLALAKAFIMSECANELTIASPFAWLSPQNTHLLDLVIPEYQRKDKSIEILALDRENEQESVESRSVSNLSRLEFSLKFDRVAIELKPTIEIGATAKRKATFLDFEHELSSPCLIEGDNGHGKSLAAYVLSRAIPFEGCAHVMCRGKIGHARLLFQNVVIQTLLRTFNRIVQMASHSEGLKINDVYASIIKQFVNYFEDSGAKTPLIGYNEGIGPKTMLEIKTILIAARLCSCPTAMILDEPEWGFSKEVATAFVMSTTKVAHSLGIPVLIISHKLWWNGIAGSRLQFLKDIHDKEGFEVRVSKRQDLEE